MVFQYLIVGISSLLTITGITLALWGARIEVKGEPNRRGLPLIVVGTLVVAVAGLLVAMAAKLLG